MCICICILRNDLIALVALHHRTGPVDGQSIAFYFHLEMCMPKQAHCSYVRTPNETCHAKFKAF